MPDDTIVISCPLIYELRFAHPDLPALTWWQESLLRNTLVAFDDELRRITTTSAFKMRLKELCENPGTRWTESDKECVYSFIEAAGSALLDSLKPLWSSGQGVPELLPTIILRNGKRIDTELDES